MKYEVINKRFTEVVADYISKGYAINTATMNGIQDERCKIDLTDGKEIVRVILRTCYDMESASDILEIVAGTAREGSRVKPHDHDRYITLWNNDLKIHLHETYYEIAKGWYGTQEELLEARKINSKRHLARRYGGDYDFGPEAAKIVLDFVRRQKGCKRATTKDIRVQHFYGGRCLTQYVVYYKDKCFRLNEYNPEKRLSKAM